MEVRAVDKLLKVVGSGTRPPVSERRTGGLDAVPALLVMAIPVFQQTIAPPPREL